VTPEWISAVVAAIMMLATGAAMFFGVRAQVKVIMAELKHLATKEEVGRIDTRLLNAEQDIRDLRRGDGYIRVVNGPIS
jgi:hypothetical protein